MVSSISYSVLPFSAGSTVSLIMTIRQFHVSLALLLHLTFHMRALASYANPTLVAKAKWEQ